MLLTRLSAAALAVAMTPLVTDGAIAGGQPPSAMFEGRFAGLGSKYAGVSIDATAGPGIRNMAGTLPTRCVLRGDVRLPGRDGAVGINFNLWIAEDDGSRLIKPDGTFAFSFSFHHRADVLNGTTYTVWIRARSPVASVRGTVRGVANDDFLASCKGERSFTARAKR